MLAIWGKFLSVFFDTDIMFSGGGDDIWSLIFAVKDEYPRHFSGVVINALT